LTKAATAAAQTLTSRAFENQWQAKFKPFRPKVSLELGFYEFSDEGMSAF